MRSHEIFRVGLAALLALAVMCALAGVPGATLVVSSSSEDSTADVPSLEKSFSPAADCSPVISALPMQWRQADTVRVPAPPIIQIREGSPTAPRSPPQFA